MEKVNALYESIFVVDLQNGEEETKALVEKFTKLIADNGTIEEVDEFRVNRLRVLHDPQEPIEEED